MGDILGNLGRLVTEHELDNKKFKSGLRDSMRADKEAHDQIRGNQKTTVSLTSKIKDGFKAAAGKVKDFVVSVIESSTIVQMAKETITGFIEALISIPFMWLMDNWANITNAIKKWAEDTWTSIKDWVANVAEQFGVSAAAVHKFFTWLETSWGDFWSRVDKGWKDAWISIQSGFSGIATSIGTFMGSVWELITNPFKALQDRDWGADWTGFWDAIGGLTTTIENWDWGDAWNNFKLQMGFQEEQKWDFADNWLTGLAGSINDFIGSSGQGLRDWAQDVAKDISIFDEKTQGLKKSWDDIADLLKDLATGEGNDDGPR